MNSKKSILTVLLLVLTLAAGTVLPGIPAKADSVSTPYLALGADLTPGERETVFSLLNVDLDELDDYNVLYVTNKDEHNYLDQYISSSVIGTRALSCVLIQKRTEGYGLQVTTHNITYCTPSMYINALSTAGITDSRVVVAGPFPISGTAALVGAMKAYEDMTGEEITEEFQDAAMNELVVEGLLGESFEDGEDDAAEAEVEEFIRELKLEVSEREFNEETEREEIEDLIRQKATERNLELSEELLEQFNNPDTYECFEFSGTADIELKQRSYAYGDKVTLVAKVRDVNMSYRLVWEATDDDERGWYTISTGSEYSFVVTPENIDRGYRVILFAVD